MDQIISAIVANGLWAVLFCGLLVYELRDSRRRENRYTQTISALTDRLNTLAEVKADTEAVLSELRSLSSAKKTKKRAAADPAAGGVPCAAAATA